MRHGEKFWDYDIISPPLPLPLQCIQSAVLTSPHLAMHIHWQLWPISWWCINSNMRGQDERCRIKMKNNSLTSHNRKEPDGTALNYIKSRFDIYHTSALPRQHLGKRKPNAEGFGEPIFESTSRTWKIGLLWKVSWSHLSLLHTTPFGLVMWNLPQQEFWSPHKHQISSNYPLVYTCRTRSSCWSTDYLLILKNFCEKWLSTLPWVILLSNGSNTQKFFHDKFLNLEYACGMRWWARTAGAL